MARLRIPPPVEADTDSLRRTLVQTFRALNDEDQEYRQPLVAIERPGQRTHITVIWDRWVPLSQQERSDIIMRAYEEVEGREATLAVSYALGLTQLEAQRMGISFEAADE